MFAALLAFVMLAGCVVTPAFATVAPGSTDEIQVGGDVATSPLPTAPEVDPGTEFPTPSPGAYAEDPGAEAPSPSPAPTDSTPAPTAENAGTASPSPSPENAAPPTDTPSPSGSPTPTEGSPTPTESSPAPANGSPAPSEASPAPTEGSADVEPSEEPDPQESEADFAELVVISKLADEPSQSPDPIAYKVTSLEPETITAGHGGYGVAPQDVQDGFLTFSLTPTTEGAQQILTLPVGTYRITQESTEAWQTIASSKTVAVAQVDTEPAPEAPDPETSEPAPETSVPASEMSEPAPETSEPAPENAPYKEPDAEPGAVLKTVTLAVGTKTEVTLLNEPRQIAAAGITYHLNLPTGFDNDKNGKDYKYESDSHEVMEIGDVSSFPKKHGFTGPDGEQIHSRAGEDDKYEHIENGVIGRNTAEGYYFVGWSSKEDGTFNANGEVNYANIDYPVSVLKGGIEGAQRYLYASESQPRYTAPAEVTDLYAIWVQCNAQSGLFGYAMELPGASFPGVDLSKSPLGWKTSSGTRLGNNGLGGSNTWQKFTVLDSGHTYGDDKVLTVEMPDSPVNGWSFIGWFNKAANMKRADPGNDPNKEYLVTPAALETSSPMKVTGASHTAVYGDANVLYSLDAVWAKVQTPASQTVPYQTEGYQNLFSDLDVLLTGGSYSNKDSRSDKTGWDAIFGTGSCDGKVVTSDKLKYDVTVAGPQVPDGWERKSGAGAAELAALTLTRPGVYRITVNPKLENVDTSGGNGGTQNNVAFDFGTVSFTFTIVPQLTVEVTKELKGRKWKDGDSFPVWVDVVGAGGLPSVQNGSFAITDATPDHKGAAVIAMAQRTDGVTSVANPGAYTVAVNETPGSEPGMSYAQPVTFQVTLAQNADGAYTLTGDGAALSTDAIGNYTAAVTLKNEYKTGDLVVTKTVTGSGADPNQAFTFHLTLSDKTVNGAKGDLHFTDGAADFTLKSGESKSVSGLANGTTYTVQETDVPEHFAPQQSTFTGTIRSDQGAQVTFTNAYTAPTGSLHIYKNVAGGVFGAEADKTFAFSVQGDRSVNGTYSDVAFHNGTATVEIKAGGVKSITGLPVGSYTVTEQNAQRYTVTGTQSVHAQSQSFAGATTTVEIADGDNAVITYTNTRKVQDLILKKTVEGDDIDPAELGSSTFGFRVNFTLDGEPLDTVFDTVLEYVDSTNGNQTVNNRVRSGELVFMTSGDTLYIRDLPVGTEYTVQEVEYNATQFAPRNAAPVRGVIQESENTLTFANEYLDSGIPSPEALTASVTLQKELQNTQAPSGSHTVGMLYAWTEQKDLGENVQVRIPVTLRLVADNAAVNGGRNELSNNGGLGYAFALNVRNTDYATAATGTLDLGSGCGLVGVPASNLAGASLDQTGYVEVYAMKPEAGSGPVTYKVQISLKATLGGASFQTDTALRDVSFTVDSDGNVAINPATPVLFTNYYKGPVQNGAPNDALVQFAESDSNPTGTYNRAYALFELVNLDARGNYRVTKKLPVSSGQKKTLVHLFEIEGSGYTFVSAQGPAGHFTPSSEGGVLEVTGSGDQGVVTFQNKIIPRATQTTLQIVTQLQTQDGGALPSGIFDFSYQVQSESENDPNNEDLLSAIAENLYVPNDLLPDRLDLAQGSRVQRILTFAEAGTYRYTVTPNAGKPDGAILYARDPVTVTVTVEQDAATGRLTIQDIAAASVSRAATWEFGKTPEGGKLTFLNMYQTGGLTVSKTVSGAQADKTKDWHFTVTLQDPTVNGSYGDMVFENGVASFTLKHGESLTAQHLPAGVAYTVTEAEADQDGYRTTAQNDTGTIPGGQQPAQAVFENRKPSGSFWPWVPPIPSGPFASSEPSGPTPSPTATPTEEGSIPRTGDEAPLGLVTALAVLAGVGLVGATTALIVRRKKKTKK